MAVPKNKRYKQVVRSRRFDQKNKLIIKKNLMLSRFKNYLPLKLTTFFLNKKINNKSLLLIGSFVHNPIIMDSSIFKQYYIKGNCLKLYNLTFLK